MDKVTAAKQVSKLAQPAGMYRPTWRSMQKLLRALCRYLPDPYPGIRRLSAETKISVPTVARLLTRAESLGLVSRAPRPTPGKYDGYTYRLSFLDSVSGSSSVSTSGEVETEEDLRSSSLTTFVKKDRRGRFGSPAARRSENRPRRTNRYTGRCHACAEIVWPGEGFLHGPLPVHRECEVRGEWEAEHARDLHGAPSLGADPEEKLPSASTRVKPQARLAKHFEARWNLDALKRYPEWRGQYRGIDLGAAIGYISRTFLDAGYSDEHVEAMIDAFFDDLLSPICLLQPSEGQSAFQLFTGWWGHNAVPDPAIERERNERAGRLHDAYVRQRDEAKERERQAWARIDAAEAAGAEADPEDLRTVRMPVPRKSPSSR